MEGHAIQPHRAMVLALNVCLKRSPTLHYTLCTKSQNLLKQIVKNTKNVSVQGIEPRFLWLESGIVATRPQH